MFIIRVLCFGTVGSVLFKQTSEYIKCIAVAELLRSHGVLRVYAVFSWRRIPRAPAFESRRIFGASEMVVQGIHHSVTARANADLLRMSLPCYSSACLIGVISVFLYMHHSVPCRMSNISKPRFQANTLHCVRNMFPCFHEATRNFKDKRFCSCKVLQI